jgi:Carboxypeptidase regulatory-like domain
MNSRRWRAVVFSFLLIGVVPCAGCNAKPTLPPPVEVTGQVTFADGQPVSDVIISFHAADETTARGKKPTGVADKAGKFTINDVTPGRYKVTLAPIPTQHGGASPKSGELSAPGKPDVKLAIPAQYLSAESSPWMISVESPPKVERFVVDGTGTK